MFGNWMSWHIFPKCVEFKLRGGEKSDGVAMKALPVWLTKLDALIAPVLMCLTEREIRAARRFKLYADFFERRVKLAMDS